MENDRMVSDKVATGMNGDRTPINMDADTATFTSGAASGQVDRLVALGEIKGTAVYNRHDELLGTAYDFLVDRITGQVTYAVMAFGDLLGMGERYHPLPWKLLTFDMVRRVFLLDLDRLLLVNSPSFSAADGPNWSDRAYGDRIDAYYESSSSRRSD